MMMDKLLSAQMTQGQDLVLATEGFLIAALKVNDGSCRLWAYSCWFAR